MARWRYNGTNWEGRSFTVSAGLVLLLNEVEGWDPVPRLLDGTVASQAHDAANPTSDHRPKPYVGPGVVRGADIGEFDDAQGDFLAEKLRASQDPRIKYVIHDGSMFSSYATSSRPAWAWGPYTGFNAHLKHNHVSVLAQADTDSTSWNLGLIEESEPIDMYAACAEGDQGQHVEAWQRVMQRINGFVPPAWGTFGPTTTAALQALTGPGNNIGPSEGARLLQLLGGTDTQPVDAYTKVESDARYAKKGATVTSKGKLP